MGGPTRKQKKYAFPADRAITTANLDAFVADVKAKKVKPMVKSEPVPTQAEQDEIGHVIKLVGDTFMDFVMQGDLEILLEVTAPWCQVCASVHVCACDVTLHSSSSVQICVFLLLSVIIQGTILRTVCLSCSFRFAK